MCVVESISIYLHWHGEPGQAIRAREKRPAAVTCNGGQWFVSAGRDDSMNVCMEAGQRAGIPTAYINVI